MQKGRLPAPLDLSQVDLEAGVARIARRGTYLAAVTPLHVPAAWEVAEYTADTRAFRRAHRGADPESIRSWLNTTLTHLDFMRPEARTQFADLLTADARRFFSAPKIDATHAETFIMVLDPKTTAAWHIDFYDPRNEKAQLVRTLTPGARTRFIRREQYSGPAFRKIRAELNEEFPKCDGVSVTERFGRLKLQMAALVRGEQGEALDMGDLLFRGSELMHCSPPCHGRRFVFTLAANLKTGS